MQRWLAAGRGDTVKRNHAGQSAASVSRTGSGTRTGSTAGSIAGARAVLVPLQVARGVLSVRENLPGRLGKGAGYAAFNQRPETVGRRTIDRSVAVRPDVKPGRTVRHQRDA